MSLVNSSGFKYYFDQLALDSGSLIGAFDFVSGSNWLIGGSTGRYLNSPDWFSGFSRRLSGLVFNPDGIVPGFFTVNGSGRLDGSSTRSIALTGNVNIPSDDFQFLFSFERSRNAVSNFIGEILISSATGLTPAYSSGFSFGITRSNKPYIEYWSSGFGKRSFTFQEINLYNSNILTLKKGQGAFSVGVFDPIVGAIDSYEYAILDNDYVHSNNFLLGGFHADCFWSRSVNHFWGYFDDFYVLTGVASDNYLTILSSGFFSNYTGGSLSGTGTICASGVVTNINGFSRTGEIGTEVLLSYSTGYVLTGFTLSGYRNLVGTGITGYQNQTFNYVDNCGATQTYTNSIPLIGPIYVTGTTGIYTGGLVPVLTPIYSTGIRTGLITGFNSYLTTGTTCTTGEIYFGRTLEIDKAFVKNLGPDRLFLLKTNQEPSFSEAYVNTGIENISNMYNQRSSYNFLYDDFTLNRNFSSNSNSIYKNGQLAFNGPATLSGVSQNGQNVYNISGGNIFIESGFILRSNGWLNASDIVYYDSGLNNSASYHSMESNFAPGTFNFYTLLGANNNSKIFMNGIKLLLGEDYASDGVSLISGISGSILIKTQLDSFQPFNRYTGSGWNFNFYINSTIPTTSGRFFKNTSLFYLNGLREAPGDGYLEHSAFDMYTVFLPVPSQDLLFEVSETAENYWNI